MTAKTPAEIQDVINRAKILLHVEMEPVVDAQLTNNQTQVTEPTEIVSIFHVVTMKDVKQLDKIAVSVDLILAELAFTILEGMTSLRVEIETKVSA